MEPIIPEPEFFFPGTFEVEPPYREGTPENMHLAGLDGIDPSFDGNPNALTGVIGFDPMDLIAPSLDTRLDIEKELPQWGPPFVKFVDGRISDLEKKVNKAIEEWSFKPQTIFFNAGMNTDGSGNINPTANANANLYSPPAGFTLALHRFGLFVDTNAATFGVPHTNTNSYYEIRVNGEAIDGGSLGTSSGGVPFVRSWGTRDAPRIRDGEQLSLLVISIGLNNTRFVVKGQGTLDRTIEG